MFEHSNMVDQENINPISGMVATRHRPQHSKPMIFEDQASSKEGGMMPSSDRGFVRQPLRDVTELFSTQLEKGGGAGAFDVAPSWQEETKAAHQACSTLPGASFKGIDGSHLQAVARNNLRRMR